MRAASQAPNAAATSAASTSYQHRPLAPISSRPAAFAGLPSRLAGPAAAPIHGPASRSARAPAAARAATKELVASFVTYTVQKGETLWDVAVQHGVSTRTIKDLNKLTGKDPEVREGQQLVVPASGISQAPAADAKADAIGSTPARGLWAGSEYVRLASVAEAKQLYLQQCDRGNSQNTLLVLFAPWCPHCRDMEDELERLAEGLAHVSAVRVVAVNADTTEGRVFAREVLGVAYYPAIITFPQHSRTFYKYKGRSRDADSLLRFLNMTCCSQQEQMWALEPRKATGATRTVSLGDKLQHSLPLGMTPTAAAAGAGLAVLAAAAALAFARSRRAASDSSASGSGSALEPDPVAELDNSLARMAVLMARAIKTRLGLMFGLRPAPLAPTAAAAVPAAAAAAATPEVVVAAALIPEPAAAAAPSPSPAEVAATAPAALDSTRVKVDEATAVPAAPAPASTSAPAAATAAAENGNGAAAAADNGNGAVAAAAEAPAAAPAPAAAAPPAAGLTRELTAEERMRLTRLTDDELIALVNSDPDLDKVLSRLLGDK
ncbi:hypothetical protein HYH03_001573 [Edaphochlamys debaryana]|uniref:Thioredoxin domain-containing protein n=1 Tax=Edaphochlamys debaryana TaxID=47281 RepID=A0A835YH21_9CHLO|nr:hypothetical protein HYH03_001573 [Edaphochlamys debaryana]|eukprot:KAG2500811.1 hypothetical protein HYH03_001573 [Edaphochlamys debaryana]